MLSDYFCLCLHRNFMYEVYFCAEKWNLRALEWIAVCLLRACNFRWVKDMTVLCYFFSIFLAVQVYTCLSLNQKRTLKFSVWSIMYTLVSSSFGMGPCRARAGGYQISKIHQPPVTQGSHHVLPWTALWLLQHAVVWFLGSHLWTTGGKDLPTYRRLILPSRMALGFGLGLFLLASSVASQKGLVLGTGVKGCGGLCIVLLTSYKVEYSKRCVSTCPNSTWTLKIGLCVVFYRYIMLLNDYRNDIIHYSTCNTVGKNYLIGWAWNHCPCSYIL